MDKYFEDWDDFNNKVIKGMFDVDNAVDKLELFGHVYNNHGDFAGGVEDYLIELNEIDKRIVSFGLDGFKEDLKLYRDAYSELIREEIDFDIDEVVDNANLLDSGSKLKSKSKMKM